MIGAWPLTAHLDWPILGEDRFVSYVVASLLLELLSHFDEKEDAEVEHADVAPVE